MRQFFEATRHYERLFACNMHDAVLVYLLQLVKEEVAIDHVQLVILYIIDVHVNEVLMDGTHIQPSHSQRASGVSSTYRGAAPAQRRSAGWRDNYTSRYM